MFTAYQSPDNFPFGSKTKVLAAPTLGAALADLITAKVAEGYTLLAADPDGETAADAAFAKGNTIVLFTIEQAA